MRHALIGNSANKVFKQQNAFPKKISKTLNRFTPWDGIHQRVVKIWAEKVTPMRYAIRA